MLVLSRRPGESIIINDDIIVTVLGIQGDKIRLGVDAPKHVRVDRMEVHIKRSINESGATPTSCPAVRK